MLHFMGSPRVGHDLETEQQEISYLMILTCAELMFNWKNLNLESLMGLALYA